MSERDKAQLTETSQPQPGDAVLTPMSEVRRDLLTVEDRVMEIGVALDAIREIGDLVGGSRGKRIVSLCWQIDNLSEEIEGEVLAQMDVER